MQRSESVKQIKHQDKERRRKLESPSDIFTEKSSCCSIIASDHTPLYRGSRNCACEFQCAGAQCLSNISHTFTFTDERLKTLNEQNASGPGVVGVFCSLVIGVLLSVFSRGVVGVLGVRGVLDGHHRTVVVGMRRVRLLQFVFA